MTRKTRTNPETQTVVIDGDWARVERTTVERQVRTTQLLEELAREHPFDTGLLPRGCIAYARGKSGEHGPTTLYVVERPAGPVEIPYKSAGRAAACAEEDLATLRLSWPYTQWTVRFLGLAIQDLHLTCTTSAIEDLNDKLFVLPMPNQYEDGHGGVCLGNLVVPEHASPAAKAAQLIEHVRSSLWNEDLMPDYGKLGLEGLQAWADRSAQDAAFGLTLPYIPHRQATLLGLLNHLLGETP